MRGGQSQTNQAGGGEHDGVVLTLVELPQARVHVAADLLQIKVRALMQDLRTTSKTAGSDPGLRRQLVQRLD